MGRTVCAAVAADAELELVGAADPQFGGTPLRRLLGDDVPDVTIDAETAALSDRGAEVVVDFTHLGAARDNLAWAAESGVHAVVGTSGFTEADHEALRAQFTRSNCLIAPNFAIGAVLMMRFAELAAPWFETAEVIELHHDQKVDAPSGTALRHGRAHGRGLPTWAPTRPAPRRRRGPGRHGPGGIRVHSVRLAGWWPTRRCCSAPPASRCHPPRQLRPVELHARRVLACKRIGEHPGVTVGLDAFLGI
jgi:4-hydroxy-tetrahydrodipicolinate reductase